MKNLYPILCLLVLSVSAFAQKQQRPDVLTIERDLNGLPASIVFSTRSDFQKGGAYELFHTYFYTDGIFNKAVLTNTTLTKQHTVVERYEQYYKGYKVEQAAASLLFDAEGHARFLNGHFYHDRSSMGCCKDQRLILESVVRPVAQKNEAPESHCGYCQKTDEGRSQNDPQQRAIPGKRYHALSATTTAKDQCTQDQYCHCLTFTKADTVLALQR